MDEHGNLLEDTDPKMKQVQWKVEQQATRAEAAADDRAAAAADTAAHLDDSGVSDSHLARALEDLSHNPAAFTQTLAAAFQQHQQQLSALPHRPGSPLLPPAVPGHPSTSSSGAPTDWPPGRTSQHGAAGGQAPGPQAQDPPLFNQADMAVLLDLTSHVLPQATANRPGQPQSLPVPPRHAPGVPNLGHGQQASQWPNMSTYEPGATGQPQQQHPTSGMLPGACHAQRSTSSAGGAQATTGTGADDPAVQRSILRELPPGCSILSMLPNRFANSKEEMCGALFSDPQCPGQYGSSVWTGTSIIKMGMYDTERDARQAAIKCMQLYWAFCSDEWRVDFYNALSAMGGTTPSPLPPPPQPQSQPHRHQQQPAVHHGTTAAEPSRAEGQCGQARGGSQDGTERLPLPLPIPSPPPPLGQPQFGMYEGPQAAHPCPEHDGPAMYGQQHNQHQQPGIFGELFNYMSEFNSTARRSGDGGEPGAGVVLGKRGVEQGPGGMAMGAGGDVQGPKRARMELDLSDGGGLTHGPVEQHRHAHRLQLHDLVKELQHAAVPGHQELVA